MAKITYLDKVALNENTDIPDNNKVNANDMNEIKNVINTNDANVGDLADLNTKNISNIVNAINEVNDKFNYSTEEQRIGTWIDGKPLYRKTIYRGQNLNSFEHGIKNVDKIIINNDYTFRVHNSGNCISLNASGAGTYTYANQSTVTINNAAGASPSQVYITLEYTKTTD